MLTVAAMSHGAQAIFYFIALIAFIVAAVVAWVVAPRAIWATLVAVGLSCWTLIAFWNALAAS